MSSRNLFIPALGALLFAALLFAVLLVSLPASPALASDMRHHREMTEAALLELGWKDESAIARVAQLSLAADIGRIPGYTRAVMQLGFPAEVADATELRALAETAPWSPDGTRGFHFNSLYRFSDIERRWRDTEEWATWVASEIGRCPATETRERARLLLFGLVAHSVQDFYCHSNWVGILDGYTPSSLEPSEFPTWEELTQDEGGWLDEHAAFDTPAALARLRLSDRGRSECVEEGGLQTGMPRTEPVLEAPIPWGHRHAGGKEMEVVRALAIRATRLWIARLDARIAEAGAEPTGPLARR